MQRRQFLAALTTLLQQNGFAAEGPVLHHAPKAKRVITLFQHGGPSQLDLFDYKPNLSKVHGQDLPDSIRMGQRLTGMTAYQATFPTAPSIFKFAQHGQSGAWFSELLPHMAKHADQWTIMKSLSTEQINHDPAVTFFQTGFQLAGRPSIGSWVSYGLGSENKDLPAFIVMISQGRGNAQALADRMWGSGTIPTYHQGVKFRGGKDPVLYLSDPEGYSRTARRRFLDDLGELNKLKLDEYQDPEIATRIAQYEMAFRMQASVPELADLSKEPESTFELYGPESRKPGTYAANCILARRLAERGVRFIQLFHRGWDQHGSLPKQIRWQCEDTDQPSAALLTDLKQRGLLDDTIVLWGGEFGRTVYSQGTLTPTDYGRDHHPRCFTMLAAGGGFKPGVSYGETDDYSYNIAKDPMDVHDLHATMMHCLGVDHTKLTFKFQGRHYRLTDVHGRVIRPLLA
ncbi:MAG: sulfatase [Acidobacteriia bacterium 12-62-4]|nr:MAG: sulfatase [Acidobacteriia bacterium 12-62-4]